MENAAKLEKKNTTVDIMVDIEVTEEKDIMGTVREGMEVLADAAVDATMAAVVPMDMVKIHVEDSNPKKKKEKS